MLMSEADKATALQGIKSQLAGLGLTVVPTVPTGSDQVMGQLDALVIGTYPDGRSVHSEVASADVGATVSKLTESGAAVVVIPVEAFGLYMDDNTHEIETLKGLMANATDTASRALSTASSASSTASTASSAASDALSQVGSLTARVAALEAAAAPATGASAPVAGQEASGT